MLYSSLLFGVKINCWLDRVATATKLLFESLNYGLLDN
jgi:hypothetical protein